MRFSIRWSGSIKDNLYVHILTSSHIVLHDLNCPSTSNCFSLENGVVSAFSFWATVKIPFSTCCVQMLQCDNSGNWNVSSSVLFWWSFLNLLCGRLTSAECRHQNKMRFWFDIFLARGLLYFLLSLASLRLLPFFTDSYFVWTETNWSHLCTTANQYYLQLIIGGLYSFMKGQWDCAPHYLGHTLARRWPILRLLAFPPETGTVYCLQVPTKVSFMVINQQWLSPLVLLPLTGPCGRWPINSTLGFPGPWLDEGYKIRSSLYCWA